MVYTINPQFQLQQWFAEKDVLTNVSPLLNLAELGTFFNLLSPLFGLWWSQLKSATNLSQSWLLLD